MDVAFEGVEEGFVVGQGPRDPEFDLVVVEFPQLPIRVAGDEKTAGNGGLVLDVGMGGGETACGGGTAGGFLVEREKRWVDESVLHGEHRIGREEFGLFTVVEKQLEVGLMRMVGREIPGKGAERCLVYGARAAAIEELLKLWVGVGGCLRSKRTEFRLQKRRRVEEFVTPHGKGWVIHLDPAFGHFDKDVKRGHKSFVEEMIEPIPLQEMRFDLSDRVRNGDIAGVIERWVRVREMFPAVEVEIKRSNATETLIEIRLKKV
jgi:hypothetical protein